MKPLEYFPAGAPLLGHQFRSMGNQEQLAPLPSSDSPGRIAGAVSQKPTTRKNQRDRRPKKISKPQPQCASVASSQATLQCRPTLWLKTRISCGAHNHRLSYETSFSLGRL